MKFVGMALLVALVAMLAWETRRREGETMRGILFGLPVGLVDDGCEPLGPITGMLLDFACDTIGFNGAVWEYEVGEYWSALWAWLTDRDDDDGPAASGGAA